jgi:hypothetical protein
MSGECVKCGTDKRQIETHHIQPSAVGGADTDENLAGLCRRCHKFAPGPELSSVVTDYPALFAEFARTRARPEYDLLRFGLSAGGRLPGQSAADAIGLFAPGADREHTAPKSPSVIWILAAVLAGYGEVERLLEAPPDQPLTNIREV